MDDYPFKNNIYDAPVRYEMNTDEIIDIFVSGYYLTSFHKADISDNLYQLFDTFVECTNCTWFGIEPTVTRNQDGFCPKCGCIVDFMKKQE